MLIFFRVSTPCIVASANLVKPPQAKVALNERLIEALLSLLIASTIKLQVLSEAEGTLVLSCRGIKNSPFFYSLNVRLNGVAVQNRQETRIQVLPEHLRRLLALHGSEGAARVGDLGRTHCRIFGTFLAGT